MRRSIVFACENAAWSFPVSETETYCTHESDNNLLQWSPTSPAPCILVVMAGTGFEMYCKYIRSLAHILRGLLEQVHSQVNIQE